MVCLAVFVAQMSSDLVGKVFGIYFVLSAFGESLRGFQLRERGGLELTCGTPPGSRLSIRARRRRHVRHPPGYDVEQEPLGGRLHLEVSPPAPANDVLLSRFGG